MKKIGKTTIIDQQNRMQIEFICTPHGYEEEKKSFLNGQVK